MSRSDPYGFPNAAPPRQHTDVLGILSLISGIISLFMCWCGVFGMIPAGLAILLGLVGAFTPSGGGSKILSYLGIAAGFLQVIIQLGMLVMAGGISMLSFLAGQ